MTITTQWQIQAEVLSEYTSPDGVVFTYVIETVHWRVTATDDVSGATETIFGAQPVAMPTDPSSFVDLSVLQGLTAEEKRLTVMGWAEAIEPGFIADKDEKVTALLVATLEAPQRVSANIL